RRIEQMVEENRELRRQLERARQSGAGDVVTELIESATAVDGVRVIAREMEVADAGELRALGDRLRERLGTGAAVIAGRAPDRVSLIAVVTDDMISRGVRADALVREIAKRTGGSGGGRPQMAHGGVGDATQVADALSSTVDMVTSLMGAARGATARARGWRCAPEPCRRCWRRAWCARWTACWTTTRCSAHLRMPRECACAAHSPRVTIVRPQRAFWP